MSVPVVPGQKRLTTDWLDASTWRRLRQAFDDGVRIGDLRDRFGVGTNTLTSLRPCRTIEEAHAVIAAQSRGVVG